MSWNVVIKNSISYIFILWGQCELISLAYLNITRVCLLHSQILWEVTAGAMGKAPAMVSDPLPAAEAAAAALPQQEEEESEEDLEEMRSRLEALKS